MLDHKIGDVTNDTYGHRTLEDLRNEIEKIEMCCKRFDYSTQKSFLLDCILCTKKPVVDPFFEVFVSTTGIFENP